MVDFIVSGMTCGHCARAVTAAVQGIDPAAKVEVDLGGKRVSIDSNADREALERAIEEAGYKVEQKAA